MLANKDENFGNARTIHNIFEKSITFQANRVMSMKSYADEELSTITRADIIRNTVEEKYGNK